MARPTKTPAQKQAAKLMRFATDERESVKSAADVLAVIGEDRPAFVPKRLATLVGRITEQATAYVEQADEHEAAAAWAEDKALTLDPSLAEQADANPA